MLASKYSNATGVVLGQVASGIGDIFGSITDYKANQTQLEIEKERGRQAAIAAGMNRKTDYLPVVIVGSVLLIGGIVVISTLKK